MCTDNVGANSGVRTNRRGRPTEMHPPDGDNISLWVLPERPETYIRTEISHFPDAAEDNEDGDKDLKPDLTMYNKEIGSQAWDIKPKTKSDRQDYRGRVAWFFAEMFMEVKRSNKYNPFDGQSLRGSQQGMKMFEQITKVAIESLNLQHRTFLFTAFIVETKARLLRWDRAGVVVSHEFDIGAEPGWLFNFVHRVATSTREAQGFDTTVTDADEDQIKKLDDFRKKQDNKYAQEYLDEMNMNRTLYPIQQLQCDIFEFAKKKIKDPENPQYSALRKKKCLTLLIGHICFAHSSLSGRGMKGFVAFVVDVDRLVFLKESWRPVNTSCLVREEGDIYCDLTGAGVPYIPFAIAGGDVSESHVTINDELLRASQRQQYRLVLWEVGIPLDRHANSFTLIRSLHQALKAHRYAWDKAGILHRDISPGNVLIDMLSPPDAPMGLLCDWELSKKKAELTEGATQHTRSGTWITLSAVSLQYPYKPIELSDDLESFYHLLTYNILRFYRHSMTKSTTTAQLMSPFQNDSESALAQHVWNYHYAHIRGDGGHPDTGGMHKWDKLNYPHPPFRLLDVESPLNRLLEDIHKLCFKHYQTVHKQDLDKYSPFSTAPTATAKKPFVLPAVDLDEYDIDDMASELPESPPTTSATITEVKEDHAPLESPLIDHARMNSAFLSILRPKKHDTLNLDLDDKIDDQFVNLPSFIGVANKKSSATRTKSSVGSGSHRSRSTSDNGSDEQPNPKRQKTEGSGPLSPMRE
ncbi:hypothetical protein BC628DRAFT_1498844 [Trametes gibbosa]|nr:hypothetical protein BC628DRAFT_1498844 [Trametes gibbosa]